MNENYTYETKCRRCGAFHEWYIGPKDKIKFSDFFTLVNDYLDHPRLKDCETCKKPTIQDVVSYTG